VPSLSKGPKVDCACIYDPSVVVVALDVSGLTPTEVFDLATSRSTIDRCREMAITILLVFAIPLLFLVAVRPTRAVSNSTTQPETVARPWQRRELDPQPLDAVWVDSVGH
jgi:hypothetical protein